MSALLPAFVTLEEARAHLAVDHDADNAMIQSQVEQASAIILDFLKLPAVPASWGEGTGGTGGTGDEPSGVPQLVKASTLLIVGELYKNREAGEVNVLSEGVKSLLRRSRHPALA